MQIWGSLFWGIVRFRREASLFAPRRRIYIRREGANGGRKNPLKPKKFAEFQPYNVSFLLFVRLKAFFIPFSDFFGLVKYDRPLFY